MADLPIIFSAPMVRALLEGRKTQTRRVIEARDLLSHPLSGPEGERDIIITHYRQGGEVESRYLFKPRYAPGDRLYVREAHALVPATAYRMSEGVEQAIDPADSDRACVYAAGWVRSKPRWRPSIHMPRWASRITLTVTEVRVQRLQDISEVDAFAEGCARWGMDTPEGSVHYTVVEDFKRLWNSLHGANAWDANPWVVALTLTVQRGNIDQIKGEKA